MRLTISAVLIAAAVPAAPTLAAPLVPVVTTLAVQAHPDVGNLECERSAPAPRRPATPNPDPLEVPDDEVVREVVQELAEAAPAPGGTTPAPAPLPGPAARIAIWGDSHLAAAFFSDELARQLKVPPDTVSNVLLPANMGRAGVRLPIRRSCVSPQWKYELGYLGGDHARTPGPGLVNLVTEQAGATLAWDVRTDKRVANYERVRILYQQTAAPTVVGISVDGTAETQVTLDRQPGPAVLELAADRPISQVKMRLIAGPMRLHGLDLQAQRAGQLAMDVFGYPGATVAGWKTPQLDYLASWFGQRDYQLVMLEFGTNEGAARPFDSAAYRRTLEESVRNMRTVFPQAACVLIAPGDRGVLVPQSVNRGKRRGKGKVKAPKIDLYRYSRVHAEIGRVQREVGAAAGCATWSMLEAMGGMGAAYTWARQKPPLMARDLIHFTVPGYQRFAREFARDMGWADADK